MNKYRTQYYDFGDLAIPNELMKCEEVLNDFTCERCGTKVEKKKLRQWVLAITKYADRLASDVEKLDWPEGIKDMQRNWI